MNPGILTPPTQFATMPRGLLGMPTPVPMPDSRFAFDVDADRYLAAVEAADGQPLEPAVRLAITQFIVGCKDDGLYQAFRAAGILLGARTLAGALTPLVGGVVTNNNFVSPDYNRRNGLTGLASASKNLSQPAATTLSTPRPFDHSMSAFPSALAPTSSVAQWHIALSNNNVGFFQFSGAIQIRSNYFLQVVHPINTAVAGAIQGFSRTAGNGFFGRAANVTAFLTQVGETSLPSPTVRPFGPSSHSSATLCFYHYGMALDLAALDARVRTLLAAIRSAIQP